MININKLFLENPKVSNFKMSHIKNILAGAPDFYEYLCFTPGLPLIQHKKEELEQNTKYDNQEWNEWIENHCKIVGTTIEEFNKQGFTYFDEVCVWFSLGSNYKRAKQRFDEKLEKYALKWADTFSRKPDFNLYTLDEIKIAVVSYLNDSFSD